MVGTWSPHPHLSQPLTTGDEPHTEHRLGLRDCKAEGKDECSKKTKQVQGVMKVKRGSGEDRQVLHQVQELGSSEEDKTDLGRKKQPLICCYLSVYEHWCMLWWVCLHIANQLNSLHVALEEWQINPVFWRWRHFVLKRCIWWQTHRLPPGSHICIQDVFFPIQSRWKQNQTAKQPFQQK